MHSEAVQDLILCLNCVDFTRGIPVGHKLQPVHTYLAKSRKAKIPVKGQE